MIDPPRGRRALTLHRLREISHRLPIVQLDEGDVMQLGAIVDEMHRHQSRRNLIRCIERVVRRIDGHLMRDRRRDSRGGVGCSAFLRRRILWSARRNQCDERKHRQRPRIEMRHKHPWLECG
jgi:hypothetical protein